MCAVLRNTVRGHEVHMCVKIALMRGLLRIDVFSAEPHLLCIFRSIKSLMIRLTALWSLHLATLLTRLFARSF